MQLSGKVCVVTGASSGIGRRTALDLAAKGATVCVAARREDRLKSLLSECQGNGHSYKVTDVSRKEDVDALAVHVEQVHGRCDVLVNNAGFPGEHRSLWDAHAVAELEDVMATNFFGAAYCTAALLPALERSAPSNVVNIASVAGRLPMAGTSAYSASKFALVGWSEALHYELAAKGICVSTIEPGLIPTEGFPQSDLLDDPLLRHVLGSEEQVSRAIQSAILTRKLGRTVPRWYYLLQVPRLLTPPLYRYALRKITPRYGRRGPLA